MSDLDVTTTMIELLILKQKFQDSERENQQDPLAAMAALVCAVEAGVPIPDWSAKFLALRFNEYLDIFEERTLDQVVGLNTGRKGQTSPKMRDLRDRWKQTALQEVWAVRHLFGLTVEKAIDEVAKRLKGLPQAKANKLHAYNSDTLRKFWNSSSNNLKKLPLENGDIDPEIRARLEAVYSIKLTKHPRNPRD